MHRERLWPGLGGWAADASLGAVVGLVFVPIDVRLAWLVGVVAAVGAVALTAALTPVVEVAGGQLRAGKAHIPVPLLGEARTLTGADLRAALGPGLDARAYVCLRGWIHSAVHVELVDPGDPTPYWIVSTRRPDALVAALTAAKAPAP